MKKKVIFTCITGGYDTLLQPLEIDESYDYVCFVSPGKSCMFEHSGIWQIKELPLGIESDVLQSRLPKVLPHLFFADYDYSIYLDGNVAIASQSFYSVIEKKISTGVVYSGVEHWSRKCAYAEAVMCAKESRASAFSLARMVAILRKNHFPRNYGMYENNVIFRKHNDSSIIAFDNEWWHYISKVCLRDQMSNSYCLWKYSIPFDYLLPSGFCARNHPYFQCIAHNRSSVIDKKSGLSRVGFRIKRKLGVLFIRLLAG